MTCSEVLQVGDEPAAAATRTEPLYMGRTLYQVIYLGTPAQIMFEDYGVTTSH